MSEKMMDILATILLIFVALAWVASIFKEEPPQVTMENLPAITTTTITPKENLECIVVDSKSTAMYCYWTDGEV